MSFAELLTATKNSWIIIAVAVLLGGLVGAGAAALAPTSYISQFEVFLNTRTTGTVAELQQGEVFAQSRAQSYIAVAKSPMVLVPAIEALGRKDTPQSLAAQMTVSVDPGTVIIRASVSDSTPEGAKALSAEIVKSLRKVVATLESNTGADGSLVDLVPLSAGAGAVTPTSPNLAVSAAEGVLAGLLLGLGTAAVRYRRRVAVTARAAAIDAPSTAGTPGPESTPGRPQRAQRAQRAQGRP